MTDRVDALVIFGATGDLAIVDRSDAGRIDWGDEADDAADAGTDDGLRIPVDRAPEDDDHRRQPDAIRAP